MPNYIIANLKQHLEKYNIFRQKIVKNIFLRILFTYVIIENVEGTGYYIAGCVDFTR